VHVHDVTGKAYPNTDLSVLPATRQLGLDPAEGTLIIEMNEAMTLLY